MENVIEIADSNETYSHGYCVIRRQNVNNSFAIRFKFDPRFATWNLNYFNYLAWNASARRRADIPVEVRHPAVIDAINSRADSRVE